MYTYTHTQPGCTGRYGHTHAYVHVVHTHAHVHTQGAGMVAPSISVQRRCTLHPLHFHLRYRLRLSRPSALARPLTRVSRWRTLVSRGRTRGSSYTEELRRLCSESGTLGCGGCGGKHVGIMHPTTSPNPPAWSRVSASKYLCAQQWRLPSAPEHKVLVCLAQGVLGCGANRVACGMTH